MKPAKLAAFLSLALAVSRLNLATAQDYDSAPALALGDSVVFGYITQAGFAYVNPTNFIGSPEYLDDLLKVRMVNAGCPGEATTSFLSATGADNGCRAYRSRFPLHVDYQSTQMDFATAFLHGHRDTRLVTIGLGANDVFLLENACALDPNPLQCIGSGLPQVLATVGTDMATILAELRATGYAGHIVLLNYYSPDYSNPTDTQITALLNQTLASAASAYDADVADVFGAFHQLAAMPAAGGKTCNTGLLNVDPQNPALCDVHPSQSGQRLIAKTVAGTRTARNWQF